jgi:excisionase family DNA binding protein
MIELLTVEQAAKQAKVSAAEILTAIASRELPAVTIRRTGRANRHHIDKSDVERWASSRWRPTVERQISRPL